VVVCLDGSGEAVVGATSWHFGENDVFVVPPWNPLQLRADKRTVLLSFSDRPVQQVLGMWREERL
jgi:gentisate 1,2-dioxygenase